MRPFCLIFCLGLILCVMPHVSAQPNVTSYSQMSAQLKADALLSPLLRVASLGKAAGGHKALWLVRVAQPGSNLAQTFRIMVLCRQHGDEPASTEAVLSLLHRLAQGGEPDLRRTLSQVTLYFVPMVNPDGADANARSNAVGADLNRDWGIFHQPETRAIAGAARLLHPDLVLDAHNWDGDDEYDADCLEVARETATPLGRSAHTLQQDAVRELAVNGYALHPTAWGADADPSLAHRWFANRHILSALVETHYGTPSDQSDFQRRQGLYAALIQYLARHYADANTGNTSAVIQDAQLFPPAVISKTRVTGLSLPHKSLCVWLWTFGLYGLALWGIVNKNGSSSKWWEKQGPAKKGYYSFTRKRDGTDTRVRSGQRKAVSIPPR